MPMSTKSRRVAYVSSPSLLAAADKLPSNEGRPSLVHGLVDALGLLDEGRAELIHSARATRDDLVKYHDAQYVG
jgi:hypothetical protein